MNFLYGLGQGLMISTLVFGIYLTVIDFIKHPNYKIMAFAFAGITTREGGQGRHG